MKIIRHKDFNAQEEERERERERVLVVLFPDLKL